MLFKTPLQGCPTSVPSGDAVWGRGPEGFSEWAFSPSGVPHPKGAFLFAEEHQEGTLLLPGTDACVDGQ